jgi:hypothetical protein
MKEVFLNDIFHAPGRKRRPVFLKAFDNLADTQFLSKSFKDDGGTDFL